ncbi:hypothetical protein EXN66_Car007019 [Channa argus]|uniref:Uncharacterized protein n=1 Tax=Channa argus TaxID=215402 RepID=A0A6G1PMH0_CHAAH|nr:hypothetical protein EXN66_Car007019 [Channa argus]
MQCSFVPSLSVPYIAAQNVDTVRADFFQWNKSEKCPPRTGFLKCLQSQPVCAFTLTLLDWLMKILVLGFNRND